MEDTIPTKVRPTVMSLVRRHVNGVRADSLATAVLPTREQNSKHHPFAPTTQRDSSSSSSRPHAVTRGSGRASPRSSSSGEGQNCVRHTLLLGLEEGLAYRITEPSCSNDASDDKFRSDVSLLVFDLSPLATKHMIEGTLPTLRIKKAAFEPYELTERSRGRFLSSQRLFRQTPCLHAALCDVFFSPVFMIASRKLSWTAVSRSEWANFMDTIRRLSEISPGFFPDSVSFTLRIGWFAVPGGVILYDGDGPMWARLEGLLS